MLSAGLAGIQEGLELSEQKEACLFDSTPLPTNLGEAITLFERSDLARNVVGDAVHAYLLEEKRREWQDYQQSVSDWDTKRYLEVL